MAPKRSGGSRGGGSRGSSSSKGSSWFGGSSKSKGSSGSSWFGSSKKKNNPYKSGGYPKQKGFSSYSSGGKTVSNSNWPKNQIPAAGTYPKSNSWSGVGGMNKVTGMGTMGSYAGAGGLKSTMKSKGMYNTAVGLGTAYVGYKVAKGVGKTIGSAMWMGYPRIYGTQSHFYGMNSQYRYMGAVNKDCDVFYDIMSGREMLRCDDWGTNRYSQGYGRNYGNTIMGMAAGLFWTLLICCCCCVGGGYFFYKKKSKGHSQGEQFEIAPINDAQQPPPMMEPQNPYPQNTVPQATYPQTTYPEPLKMDGFPQTQPAPASFGANSYNPYPTDSIVQNAAPSAPPAAYDQAPGYAPPGYQPPNPGSSAMPPGGMPLAGM